MIEPHSQQLPQATKLFESRNIQPLSESYPHFSQVLVQGQCTKDLQEKILDL